MENRQNKPPEGGAASGHGGQKFHTDSEQAKLHKSKLRMESREERLNKARERLAKQKPPKKPGPIKRIARIAGHETHAFLHGKVYQEDLLYDKATNKQFITVQTSGGNTFYIVIDYDKPTDEDGEQYHTYFLNMVDEADLLAAMQAAGGELPECSCADKCAVGAINTDCTVCAVNMSECQGKAPEPAPVVEPEPDPEPEQPKATGNGGILLLALAVVVIGGGAGWYFKIYRPKKQRAAESEADYGGEYDGAEDYDETAPEDDGPPWDEDGEE